MSGEPDLADFPTFGMPGTLHFATEPDIIPTYNETEYPTEVPGGESNEPFILENAVLNLNPLVEQVPLNWQGPLAIGPYATLWQLAQQAASPSEFYALLAQRVNPEQPALIGTPNSSVNYLRTLTTSGTAVSPDITQLQLVQLT